MGGWVSSRIGLDSTRRKKYCPCRDRNTGLSSCSPSYRELPVDTWVALLIPRITYHASPTSYVKSVVRLLMGISPLLKTVKRAIFYRMEVKCDIVCSYSRECPKYKKVNEPELKTLLNRKRKSYSQLHKCNLKSLKRQESCRTHHAT